MSHCSISPWAYTDLQNQAKSKVHKDQMVKERLKVRALQLSTERSETQYYTELEMGST